MRYCLGSHAFRRLPWWIFGGLVEEHRERFYPCLLAGFGRSKGAGAGGLLGRAEVAAAAFFGALLKVQPKDFAVRHAAAEVFGADASYGTDFANGANTEAGLRRRGGSARC